MLGQKKTKLQLLSQYSDQWWLATEKAKEKDKRGKAVADACNRAAIRREQDNMPQRWRNYVYYREMTGRPSLSQFMYGMAKRPESFVRYYSNFSFSGAKSGFAASMADVYTNRLLGHQTFVSMIPDDGNYDDRMQAEEIESWIEGGFDQLNWWRERTTGCIEAFWYGTGAWKFHDDGNGNPKITATNPDCLLYSNPDDTDPYDVIERVWAKKTDLLEQHKDDTVAIDAIVNAPTAEPAFYFSRTGSLDCSDVVALLDCYTRPIGKTPGRHVTCVGDFAFIDEKWEYPHPYELWCFDELPGCLFGQGIAEKLLQISQWVDGLLSTIQESELRAGAPKWMVEENSNANPDTLGDLNAAIVSYLGTKPELVTPEAIGQYALQHLEMLLSLGRSRVHVSESAVKGESPTGLTSGVALTKWAQIDDQNFLEKIGRLEELDKRAAYQLIMLGKRLEPDFIRTGRNKRKIAWKSIKLNPNFRINDLQAYNVGRLSQTVAGRIQLLKEMYAEGTIDKKLYVKYQQTPDINGMFSELNSDADSVQSQLDELVKSDEFIPPSPYMDHLFAKQQVEDRYQREIALKSPQHVLDRLSIWRAVVINYIAQNNTPDAAMQQEPAIPGATPTADPMAGAAPMSDPGMAQPMPGAGMPPEAAPPSLPLLNNSMAPM